MTSLRVCSINVLFEAYYQKYCKADVMKTADRFAAFKQWAEEKILDYDYIAMQEWPYSGVTAEQWNGLLNHFQEKAGLQVLYHIACNQAGVTSLVSRDCEVLNHRVHSLGRGKSYSCTVIKKNGVVVGLINAHVPWAPNKEFAFQSVSKIFENISDCTPHWIAVGDWNVEAISDQDVDRFKEIAIPKGFVELSSEFPKTCASDSGLSKIDYIVTSPSVEVLTSNSYPDVKHAIKHSDRYERPHYSSLWFSDHVAVEAEVKIPN